MEEVITENKMPRPHARAFRNGIRELWDWDGPPQQNRSAVLGQSIEVQPVAVEHVGVTSVVPPAEIPLSKTLLGGRAVSVDEKVTVLALAECEVAVKGAGMKFNAAVRVWAHPSDASPFACSLRAALPRER